jgi:hypothetical protein
MGTVVPMMALLGFAHQCKESKWVFAPRSTGFVPNCMRSPRPWRTSAVMESICRGRVGSLQPRSSSAVSPRPSPLPGGTSPVPGRVFTGFGTASQMPSGPSNRPEIAYILPWRASFSLERLYWTPCKLPTPIARASPNHRSSSLQERSFVSIVSKSITGPWTNILKEADALATAT